MEFGRGQKEKGTDSLGERHGQWETSTGLGRDARTVGKRRRQFEPH